MSQPIPVAPYLTPRGRLYLAAEPDAFPLEAALAERITSAFDRGSGHGLLHLGACEQGTALPPVMGFWRDFAGLFIATLCHLPDVEERLARRPIPAPAAGELAPIVAAAPPMTGSEYLTMDVLVALWAQMNNAFQIEWSHSGTTAQTFLQSLNPAWNLVGRIHFNLTENHGSDSAPFGFLATYTHRLSSHGKAQHLPLGQALEEYAGRNSRGHLQSLLLPVQRAADACPWLRNMVDSGEIFQPLDWGPADAFRFLNDIPALEAAGVVVRLPASWKENRPARPVVSASIGTGPPSSALGRDALLDFRMEVTLDGEVISEAEVQEILSRTNGLALVRGRWVEVNRERLRSMLGQFHKVEREAQQGGLSFEEAMRLLSGAAIEGAPVEGRDMVWSRITAGPWLSETLRGLRSPEGLPRIDPGESLKTTLRPYQQTGVQWLHLLQELGLGACLADDMGLGKTVQVLALVLVMKSRAAGHPRPPSLIVAPASLLANWASEIERFTPGLNAVVAHASAMPAEELKHFDTTRLANVDFVITSYGSLLRLPWLQSTSWDLVVADEAQAIKNPRAKQTRALKKLYARARIALTGTPVENRINDLWSIFDFVNPGLLGSARAFGAYARNLANRAHNPYGPLRDLVRPYILRRLKTDTSVIVDLPEKTEMMAWCPLTRKQAALYQQAVKDLARQIRNATGIRRKGTVLAALMRFKQICNHPSQWLGDNSWAEADSGKLARLREIAEVISARQEKALVFTQFREMTDPLVRFLGSVFGRPGLVLHGGTAVKQRRALVRQFQDDEQVPFFVLSVKAGGTGLNLTAASHVIHFDRWWNPAVEDQATDRAFRIGQKKNVIVHKFVCRGTVEEKIEHLIASKRQLSRDLLEGGAEPLLTEMSNEEILQMVSLDIHHALKEV